MNNTKVLISSCLVGIPTNYKEQSQTIEILKKLVDEGRAIFVCPEQLGGLTTPRDPAEIEYGKTAKNVLAGSGRIYTNKKVDVTIEYVQGAIRVLDLCRQYNIKTAVLKERSPSCGSKMVYDGSFSGTKIIGNGITAELLRQNGIKVYSEETLPKNFN